MRKFLARILNRIMPSINHYWSLGQLDQLRNHAGTFIAANVTLEQGSGINVQGRYRELFIGEKVYFRKFCTILMFPDARLRINDNVFFNNNCSVNCLFDIEIGTGTLFGEGVKIYDHNHSYYNEADGKFCINEGQYTYGGIKIGNNCWIGSNVTILKGVEIGDNTIIGANCLIYKSVPSNSIVKHIEQLSVQAIGK